MSFSFIGKTSVQAAVAVATAVVLSGCDPSGTAANTGTAPRPGAKAPVPSTPTPSDGVVESAGGAPTKNCDVAKLRANASTVWAARKAKDCQTLFDFEVKEYFESPDKDGPVATWQEFCMWYEESEPFVVESYELKDALIAESCEWGWVHVTARKSVARFPTVPARDIDRWEQWCFYEGDWKPVPGPAVEGGAFPQAPSLRDADSEAIIADRFAKVWDARVKKDWDAMTTFTDPRDLDVIESDLAQRGLIDYLECSVLWIEAIGNRGTVRVSVTHKWNDPSMSKFPPSTTVINERWVKYDGAWYLDLNSGN